MKHLKTFFAFMLMTVLSIGQVWAADVSVSFASWTTSINAYSATEWTDNGCTFTYANNNQKGWAYVRCGGKGTTASSTIKYNTKIGVPVESVVLNTPNKISNGSSSSITITGVEVAAYSDAAFTTLVSSKNLGTLSYTSSNCPTSFTITPTTAWAKDLYYKITISWTATGSKNCGLNVSGITFNEYEEIPSPSVSVSPTSWDFETVHASDAASKVFSVSGSNLTAGQNLSIAVPDGYSVSPNSITVSDATLTATNVTVSKNTTTVGTYNGNMSISGGGQTSAKMVGLSMTVDADPAPTGTFKLFSGDLTAGKYVICDGTNAMKNTATSAPRIEAATVSVNAENKIVNPDAAVIWNVEFLTGDDVDYFTLYNEAASKYAAFTSTNGRGTLVDAVSNYAKWQYSENEFSNKGLTGKYLRFNNGYGFASYATTTGNELTLYKLDDGKPSAPTFSPAGGSFLEAQSVTLSAEAGAEIYYTMGENPADPTSGSTHYTGAIAVSSTTTIKAVAIKDDKSSNVASATYTIFNTAHAGTAEDPYSVADAITVIDGIGTKEDAYVSGIISQVDSYNSTYKSITYWISADGTTTNQLQVYSGKGIEGADFSSVDDVVAKATVVVKGTLKKHNDTYEFDYNNELVSYAAPIEPVVTLKQSGSTVTSLNLDATGVANQAIDVECTNFADAISSVTAELYEESTCDTKITSGAWVTDITVNGAKDQVTFNVADNAGEARQVWMKVTASDGSKSASAVLAISQAKFIVDYATLPFAYNGNGTGELPNGLTVSGTGTYTTAPAIKFDGANDNIIIKINADPGTLTYDIKGNSYSNSTFKVQQSANGVDYTDVATYSTLGSDVKSESKTLAQTTRYVKFIYTNKSSGNVALGNIAIAAYVAPTACEAPTFNPADGESFTESLDVVLTSATEGATIYYTIDESDPTTSSSVFNTKITLTETTTIKAIAIKDGLNNSSVASATYTKAVTITSYNIDFETNNLAAYVNWDFNNIAIVSTAIDAHGGTYYGNTGGMASASITTKAKIAAPGPLTFWTSKESGNTTASYWTVEVSEDGSAWTQVGDPFSAITGSKGDWTKCEADLSEHTNVYVRISYGSSSAIRAIDDISLEMAAVKPKITTQPVGAEYTKDEDAEALTIVAEAANSGALSYQWYSNSSESTEGAEAIEGADDNEYTPSTTSLGTVYYYCVVTEVGAEETTTSSIVAVVVSAAPEPTGTFELFSGDLVEDDYVIYYDGKAMKNVIESNRFSYLEVTPSANKIENPDEAIIWHIAASGDYWTLYNAAIEKYASTTTTNNQGALADDTSDDKALWSITGSSTYEFVNKGRASVNNKYLRNNGAYGFGVYANGTGGALTLYKKSDGKPAAPTFSPEGGLFLEAQSVTISATTGASIYYTTDGTNPSTSSTLYTGAIEVSSTTTIKAIAVKDAVSSNVATATYTIVTTDHAGTAEDPYSVADARTVIDAVGTKENAFVSGIISQVDSYSEQYNSITYWISDNGTTTNQLQVYSGKGIDGADFSSVDELAANATVVVRGTLKKHNDTYEFDYNNELVSYEASAEPIVTLKQSGSTVIVLNLEATSVVNQAIDVVCANFASAVSSVSAKLYGESTCETEITSGAWVTDITINGEKDQVTFNVADNEGARRQVWMKVSASDGNNEASATMKISQAKAAYATYPFAFDGGIEDVTNAGGMTQYGLGSDYNSSPKLKFDDTGDWLIIKTNEAPSQLTYDIKNNSFSGGTFTVQESADGENYTEVASYTDITGTQNEAVDLDQATRYIKFIYTEKVTGNVGLGNINITKYVAPEPPTPEEIWTEGVREELIEGRYYTMCLDKAVTKVRGASIWKVLSKATDGGIILEEVVGTLDAGRPYFFYATAESMDVVYTGAVVDDPVNDADNNGLIGSFERTEITKNQSNYILHNNALYFVNSEAYVGAYRAYLNMSAVPNYVPAQGNSPRRRVTMSVHAQDVATGVDAISDSEQPMKVMIDNNLYIIRAGQMYDMTGNKVK